MRDRLKIRGIGFIALVLVVLAVACTGQPADVVDTGAPTEAPTSPPEATPTASPAPTEDTSSADATATRAAEDRPPAGAESQFSTDFSKHSVPYTEILSGGPPKDGIPSIDDPTFVDVEAADAWLEPREPVIAFQIGDDVRAYPLQILTWHEIVNDTVGGTPVTVTFCPLCNTAIAFERTVDGQVLDFGTTGRLRFSNLIMYDRQTESWWQQATGEAIVGEMTGTQLEFLPAPIVAWEDFKAEHPDGQVLSRETGFARRYGENPYAGYDNVDSRPFLYDGPAIKENLRPMARVLTVDIGEQPVAYPYDVLQDQRVVNDTVGGRDVVVFWQPGTASALDAGQISEGRDVGAATAYSRELDGQTLTFSWNSDAIVDDQTGSEWNVFGEAIDGELEGSRLEEVVSVNHFWFSWAAFKPETRVYQPDES